MIKEAYESARHAEDFKSVCEAFGVKQCFVAGWCVFMIFEMNLVRVIDCTVLSVFRGNDGGVVGRLAVSIAQAPRPTHIEF